MVEQQNQQLQQQIQQMSRQHLEDQSEIKRLKAQVAHLQNQIKRLTAQKSQRNPSLSHRSQNQASVAELSARQQRNRSSQRRREEQQSAHASKDESGGTSDETDQQMLLFTWHRAGQLENEVIRLMLSSESTMASIARHKYETAGVTNFYHMTVRAPSGLILYQLENATANFRTVELITEQRDDDDQKVFKVVQRASLSQRRYGPSLIMVKGAQDGQYVILVSGGAADGEELKTCEYYTPETDRWRGGDAAAGGIPQPMNEGRYQHASCILNDTVYVFCGYNRTKQSVASENVTAVQMVSSIESLDVTTSGLFKRNRKSGENDSDPTAWRLILAPASELAPRCYPIVTPLNDVEVLIMGGYDSNQLVDDAVIFDSESEQCHKVATDPSFQFYAFGNQTYCLQSNEFVALVKNSKDEPEIIRYTRGEPTVDILHTLPKY